MEPKPTDKVRTTVYVRKDILKRIKHLIADKDRTGINTLTEAINLGLEKLAKKGKA